MIPLTIAAGIEVHQIIGISVLVITVLSWFVNYIQGNTPDGVPRQPQRPRPKPQSGRSEIEELLQELSGEKRKPKPEQREQPPRPPKPQPQPERARAKPKPAPQKPANLSPAPSSRPTARVSGSALPSANLGGNIRSHQLGNQIDVAVQKEVAAVSHDLGNRIGAALPAQERPLHPLVKVLRDPNGIRQAILLNEILQRPKALRR